MKVNKALSRLGICIVPLGLAIATQGQSPNQPANPSPAHQAGSASINPSICASVSDPNGGNLQVRYHGRKRPANGNQKFTIVFLPDTQYYTEEPQGAHGGNIAMFNAQTAWIAANRASKNIVYVGQLGDCVQNGDNPPGSNNEIEWQRAGPAIATIESPTLTGLPEGIPFGICVGNHDQTPGGSPTGTTNYYNQYFGSAHFAGRSYYGGHNGSNNDNHYQLFSASGVDFLVISFEYDQTTGFSAAGGALSWAEGLVQTYPNRKVIVMTHWAINESTSFSTQGQAIYDRLKVYPNFVMLMGGHVHTSDGEAHKTNIYNGNTVHSILSDYQSRPGGGNGLLRLYEFDPVLSKISVKTYSPYTDTYETDADSQFELPFNMLPMIGQQNAIASGTTPCFSWSNLQFSTEYEWNLELYDGTNKTMGPVWRFTTPSGTPLPVHLQSFEARQERNNIRLSWTTSQEINSDRFEIERLEGSDYVKLGEVRAAGTSASTRGYSWSDVNPLPGRSYYRLKMVDRDGQWKYSAVKSVNFTHSQPFLVRPNPSRAGGQFNIILNQPAREALNIAVFDMMGREVFVETRYNSLASFTIKPGVPSGAYTIQITTASWKASQRIAVMD